MLRNNALFLEKSCRQALEAHQRTLYSFKNTFLSRNLDQSMLKNASFFGKIWKNRRSEGSSAPKFPLAPAADPPLASPTCYFHSTYVLLFSTDAQISRHRYLK